jgi:acetoacetate decarboxylase
MRKIEFKTEKDLKMRDDEVLERAFAMPLTNPAYPPGPYRFVNRE